MDKAELKSYIESKFPQCKQEDSFDFPVLIAEKSELFQIAQQLNTSPDTQFDFLFCETAVDKKTHFEVVYHLTSSVFHHNLVVKVILEDRVNPEVDSVYPLWMAADLYENEIFDLFGIRFKNHPNLRRIMLGDEWPGFPLRKDYKDDVNIVTL
ncbi:MAG: NADH-quinone oxidoreductase subunit C [Bacteroidetes bacterium]|nr:NADH-quinone oxidoreductase subunit C [Bacteroidota bacterium]